MMSMVAQGGQGHNNMQPTTLDAQVIGPFCATSHSFDGTQQRASITLTSGQLAECRRVAAARRAANKSQGTTDMKFADNKRPGKELDIQGAVGELAFCLITGAPIEMYDVTCRSAASEKRFDAVLEGGLTVDVKTTIYRNAPLQVTPWKAVNAPAAYALMIIDNADLARRSFDALYASSPADDAPAIEVRLVGMMTAAEVFRAHNMLGCKYQVHQRQLKCLDRVRKEWHHGAAVAK
jgi:hypothetical protein